MVTLTTFDRAISMKLAEPNIFEKLSPVNSLINNFRGNCGNKNDLKHVQTCPINNVRDN